MINGIELVGRVLIMILISTALMIYISGIYIEQEHKVKYNECLQKDTDTSCSLRWNQVPVEMYYWEQGLG